MPTLEQTDETCSPTLNLTEYLILMALHARPLYGLEIKRAINECEARPTPLTVGTLYTTLEKLLEKEFVEADRDKTPRTKSRRHYDLTPLGRSTLKQRLLWEQRLLAYKRQP